MGTLILAIGAPFRAEDVVVGSPVSLVVTADGTRPFSYQWRKNGADLSGATDESYRIAAMQFADAGTYTVVVSNSAGSTTSTPATLTVLALATSFAIQNPDQAATAGYAVWFAATGAADGGRWQVYPNGGSTWGDLAADDHYRGVNTALLEISRVNPAMDHNRYRYVVSGSTSTPAALTVTPAYFPFPVGIAADGYGNLFVSDTATDSIRKISANGVVTLLVGSPGQMGTADGRGTSARFNDPAGVAALADATLSVADSANGTIRRVTPAGDVSTLAGSTTNRGNVDGSGASATFSAPLGVAYDSSGNLYVADALNHTIRRVSPGGAVSTLAGMPGATGSTDGTGAIARFNHPTGITVDRTGNVYVTDTTNNTIRKVTPAGDVTTLAGLPGVSGLQDGSASGALFNQPSGLAVDAAGNLYLTDTGNSTIRKITPTGDVTTVAGLPGIAGLKDGTGRSAWFNQPQGVVLDSSGNLTVTDTGNAALRKVTQFGVVTTIALSGESIAPDATGSPAAPSTTPSVTSTGSNSSSGGGGGSLGISFAAALGLAGLLRWIRLSRRQASD